MNLDESSKVGKILAETAGNSHEDVPLSSLWDISALSLHTPEYVENYVGHLDELIGDKNQEILDSAGGTGFPAIALAQRGYKNITASDADVGGLELLKKRAEQAGVQIEVIHATWQQLSTATDKTFDVLLNTDNSLPYFASWRAGNEGYLSPEEMFAGLKQVLGEFYRVLKSGGKAIIALTSTQNRDMTHRVIDFSPIKYEGIDAKVQWDVTYDWEKRLKHWQSNIKFGDQNRSLGMISYLFTREELVNLLREVGFEVSEVVEDPKIYDNLIVAQKR